jgi:hypothetical protein
MEITQVKCEYCVDKPIFEETKLSAWCVEMLSEWDNLHCARDDEEDLYMFYVPTEPQKGWAIDTPQLYLFQTLKELVHI